MLYKRLIEGILYGNITRGIINFISKDGDFKEP